MNWALKLEREMFAMSRLTLLLMFFGVSASVFAGERHEVLDEFGQQEDCTPESLRKCSRDVAHRSDPNYCKKVGRAQSCYEKRAHACLQGQELKETLEDLKGNAEILDKICGTKDQSEGIHCLGSVESFERQVMSCSMWTILQLSHVALSEASSKADAICIITLKLASCLKPYFERKCGKEFVSDLHEEIMRQLKVKYPSQIGPQCLSSSRDWN